MGISGTVHIGKIYILASSAPRLRFRCTPGTFTYFLRGFGYYLLGTSLIHIHHTRALPFGFPMPEVMKSGSVVVVASSLDADNWLAPQSRVWGHFGEHDWLERILNLG